MLSVPVSYCQLVKAVDDAEYFAKFHPVMKRNLDGGHFTLVSCRHDPPCRDLTDEEVDELWRRFKEKVSG